VLGIAVGVVIPYVALRLERTRFFDLADSYEPLYAFAVGLLVLALASDAHANLFLAAFSAGVTTVTVSPRFKEAFHEFGELLTELLKLAAILLFGALISPAFLGEISVGGYAFAPFALVAAPWWPSCSPFWGAASTGRNGPRRPGSGPRGSRRRSTGCSTSSPASRCRTRCFTSSPWWSWRPSSSIPRPTSSSPADSGGGRPQRKTLNRITGAPLADGHGTRIKP